MEEVTQNRPTPFIARCGTTILRSFFYTIQLWEDDGWNTPDWAMRTAWG
jgi:hypothetical protein